MIETVVKGCERDRERRETRVEIDTEEDLSEVGGMRSEDKRRDKHDRTTLKYVGKASRKHRREANGEETP